MSTSEPKPTLSDDELLDAVRAALDEDEPVPPGAVEFATNAFVWRDVDAELAELLHDSAGEDAMVLRDDTPVRLLVFQAGEMTLDIECRPDAIVGAISPAGRYRIEVQDGDPGSGQAGSHIAVSDDTGMFELPPERRATVRFLVSAPEGEVAILSPWVSL